MMRRGAEASIALLGAAGVLAAAWAAPWLKFVLTIALAKGIAVLGILLLLRAGQVTFGHAVYLAAGAYTVAFLAPSAGEAFLLLPVAALVSGLLGLVVGLFVVRYRDIFFGMLNLAISMVFYSLLEKLYSLTRGTDGIRVEPPTRSTRSRSAMVIPAFSSAISMTSSTRSAVRWSRSSVSFSKFSRVTVKSMGPWEVSMKISASPTLLRVCLAVSHCSRRMPRTRGSPS